MNANDIAWHSIHDFFHGWGYQSPDGKETIWCSELHGLLKLKRFKPQLMPKYFRMLRLPRRRHRKRQLVWLRAHPWKTPTRLVTPRFTKSVDELRTWTMDLRKVLSSSSLKEPVREQT
jgi:hypothetical protein